VITQGSISGKEKRISLYSKMSRIALELTQLPDQLVKGFFPPPKGGWYVMSASHLHPVPHLRTVEVYLYLSYMPSGCGQESYFLLYEASYSKWLRTSHSSVPLLSRP
jgi:hypothetical protein